PLTEVQLRPGLTSLDAERACLRDGVRRFQRALQGTAHHRFDLQSGKSIRQPSRLRPPLARKAHTWCATCEYPARCPRVGMPDEDEPHQRFDVVNALAEPIDGTLPEMRSGTT